MPVASTRPRFPELAAAIARNGLNLTQVGHRVGCSGQYISHVIRGHGAPSEALQERLAEVLDRPVAELFAESTS